VAGAAEREREREERKRERMERRKAEIDGRKHKFSDQKYLEQKGDIAENLDDAVSQVIAYRKIMHNMNNNR